MLFVDAIVAFVYFLIPQPEIDWCIYTFQSFKITR